MSNQAYMGTRVADRDWWVVEQHAIALLARIDSTAYVITTSVARGNGNRRLPIGIVKGKGEIQSMSTVFGWCSKRPTSHWAVSDVPQPKLWLRKSFFEIRSNYPCILGFPVALTCLDSP